VLRLRPANKTSIEPLENSNSPQAKKARQIRSNVKTMLISSFDATGTVHKEFVRPGQTVNEQFCLKVLKRLCDSVQKKRPEMWSSGNWFLHHDNIPAHTALSVQQFLAKNNMTVIPHPRYSPNLAPCDFFLFHRMKGQIKGKRFAMSAKRKRKRWRSRTTSALKSSRNVNSSGKNVGTSVSSQKESTLKETRVVIA